jgi:hypothetical protein
MMNRLANCLWQDENGVILSAELVVVGSVLVIGLITGVTTLQEAVNGEMEDLAGAIGSLDQSYRFSGWTRRMGFTEAFTAGSWFYDRMDQYNEPDGYTMPGIYSQPVIFDTGVPALKITEWPTDSNVVPYAPGAVPAGCDSCPPLTEHKKSFINIPANVW